MDTQHHDILVQILASVDALFVPVRDWSGTWPQNAAAGRKTYRENGFLFRSGRQTPAEQVRASRALRALASRGQIERQTPPGSRFPYVRLVPATEGATRRRCGLPTMQDAWTVCRKLQQHAVLVQHRDGWVHEQTMCREPREVPGLVASMTPALVAGFAESGTDARGRASYRLTTKGLSWLAGNPPAEAEGVPNPAFSKLYKQVFSEALERVKTAPPAKPAELGMLPLRAGTGMISKDSEKMA